MKCRSQSPAAWLSAAALVLAACTSGPGADVAATTTPDRGDAPTAEPTATPSAGDDRAQGAIAAGCAEALGPAPADAVITVLVDDSLIELTAGSNWDFPRNVTATCILDDVALRGELVWNPTAERLLVGTSLVAGATATSEFTQATAAVWSRPTGAATIEAIDGALLKTSIETGAVTDVSFLAHHDAVSYYPSGTHIVTSGTDVDGTTGMWLATNLGSDPKLLAEAAATLSNITVGHDGSSLTFVADHGDEVHVHRVTLAGEDVLSGPNEAQADTLLTLDELPSAVVVEPYGWLTAIQSAACDTSIWASGVEFDMVGIDGALSPVGWMNSDQLVVLRREAGCSGPGDLYLLDDQKSELLARNVTAAAIREAVDPPPPPPSENFSGFA